MKKVLKLISIILAGLLSSGVLYVTNALVGNPISKYLVNKAATQYVEAQYGDLNLVQSGAKFNFKDGNYYVKLSSEANEDLYFTLYYSQAGKLKVDLYENNITHGWNVITRLANEYRNEVDPLLESLKNEGVLQGAKEFWYSGRLVAKFEIEQTPELFNGKTGGIDSSKLELGKEHDVSELGKIGGLIDVTASFSDLDASYERSAKVLLQIKDAFDKANVGFCYITLGVINSNNEFAHRINNFLYEDIYEEGLAERIQKAKMQSPVS